MHLELSLKASPLKPVLHGHRQGASHGLTETPSCPARTLSKENIWGDTNHGGGVLASQRYDAVFLQGRSGLCPAQHSCPAGCYLLSSSRGVQAQLAASPCSSSCLFCTEGADCPVSWNRILYPAAVGFVLIEVIFSWIFPCRTIINVQQVVNHPVFFCH